MLDRHRKSIVVVFALSLLFLEVYLPVAFSQENEVDPEVIVKLLEGRIQPSFVPGEVIVKMKEVEGELEAVPMAMLNRLNLATEGQVTSGGEFIYRLETSMLESMTAEEAGDQTLATVQALKDDPNVEYAQPNYLLQMAAEPDDSHYAKQWHYFDNGAGPGESPGGISLPTAWDSNQGSQSVVVAVLDTGILPNHQDISGTANIVPGYDMISHICVGGTCVANDGDGRDANPTDPGDAVGTNECMVFGSPPHSAQPDSWHGTHVSGTIGVGNTNNNLGVAGINWNVSVQAVRVLGKCGGSTVDINDAIRWAAGLPVPGVPNNTTPAKIINMSLGGSGACANSPAQQSAIDDAVAAGVTVVVAAGNSAANASGYHPASCKNVITVAASDARGRLVNRYSNYGSTVEIMAPGGDVRQDANNDGRPDGVLSMVQSGSPMSSYSGGYAYYNGTSMAAPHVAGAAALLLAEDPSLSPAEILAELQARAIPRSSVECPKLCGAGLLSTLGDGFRLMVNPLTIKFRSSGNEKSLVASVSDRDGPVVGAAVTFESNNTGVVRVVPETVATDEDGEATATVTAQSNGKTTIDVEAEKDGEESKKQVPAKVPTGSTWGLVLLALATMLILRRIAGPEHDG